MSSHVLQPALDALKQEFDAACQKASERAEASVLNRLNQLLRRFRQYQNEAEWLQILLDGGSAFAEQVAIFTVEDAIVRLRLQKNLELPPNFSFRLPQARAFASAFELKDPVTTLRMPSEVTARLSENKTTERAHLFPILNGTRVVAILFSAGPSTLDMNAIELVCGISASVLERKANAALHAQITLAAPVVQIPEEPHAAEPPAAGYHTAPAVHIKAPAAVPAVAATVQILSPRSMMPAWPDLDGDQRQLHLRAQRFARVAVAEIQLARPEACRTGREQGDIYLFLKREIDKARESYHKQFMHVPSMVDYLHLELVQTAAEGDEQKLGADYPGQLL